MTLFFGAPVRVMVNGEYEYGVTRFGASDIPLRNTAQSVLAVAKDFVDGYDTCADPGQFIIVGLGVSNCSIGGGTGDCDGNQSYKTAAWISGHGAALAAVVEDLNDWIYPNYADHVYARGAWDMEPSWSSKGKAEDWIVGHDQATTALLLGNFAADGCPKTRVYNSTANGSCNNDWGQQKMWHMSNVHQVLVFPQIYKEDMAIQWMRIEEYGNHAQSDGLYFTGAMGGQNTDNNTAHLAHLDLWDELNNPSGHSPNHGAQATMNYATLTFAPGHGLHDH